MKLARYWTRAKATATSLKGRQVMAVARGWSNDSIDAARQLALDIAQQVADRLATGTQNQLRRHYPYGVRPLPEPVLREFDATERSIVPGFTDLITNHDQETKAASTLPLA
jgi:hypothetical protein